MTKSIKAWTYSKYISDTLLMLLCRYGLKYELPPDDEANETKIYDHIRILSNEVTQRFSNDVYGNHGISPKYLRSLLVPVGIDFALDVNVSNSLQKLSQERGEYAHKGFVKRSLAPEDALKYIQDCLSLAIHVKGKALTKKWGDLDGALACSSVPRQRA